MSAFYLFLSFVVACIKSWCSSL